MSAVKKGKGVFMDNTELMKKIDELTTDTTIYGTNLFMNFVAKEVVEAIEHKKDSVSIDMILAIFQMAKVFSKQMDGEQRLEKKHYLK